MPLNGSTFKNSFTNLLEIWKETNLSFYCDNKTFFESEELNMLTYNISNTLPVFRKEIRIKINHTRESKGAANVRCIIDTV